MSAYQQKTVSNELSKIIQLLSKTEAGSKTIKSDRIMRKNYMLKLTTCFASTIGNTYKGPAGEMNLREKKSELVF